MESAKGQTLEAAWPSMTVEDRKRVADQVAECLRQFRGLQSAQMQTVDGGPLYSAWLFKSKPQTPHGPLHSDQELWEELALALTQKNVPAKALDKFRHQLPPSDPYIFTHGDLYSENIIVKDGNLLSIIDWESAGFYPVWWEYVAASIGLGPVDAEWKALLKERLSPHLEARQFWLDFHALSQYPTLRENGQRLLESLLEE